MSVPFDMMEEEIVEQTPPMSESEVLVAVDQEIRWASDLLQDDLSANRSRAWEYFEGKSPKILDEDVDEYFTSIVSRDIADAVEATLAEILPAFATDRPAEFDPVGPGDEDQAAMESDICNDVLMEAGAGFLELTTAAKNALLLRIGALEVIWDDQETVQYETIENATPEMLAQIDADPNVEMREVEGTQVVDMNTGMSLGSMTVQVLRRDRMQRCRVEAVPVDELLISSDAMSLDLDSARFVARKVLVSRSDLIAQGYPPEVVDGLTAYTTTSTGRSRSARERNTWGREKHSGDRGMDLIMTVRAYYRLDEDRDGIAELRRILVAGTPGGWTLMEDEPIDYQPFAAGAAYIWPHMPYGISLYDKLRQVQDLKTKFWRIQLEAGQRAARDRVALPPGTNMDQWMSIQFGGAVITPNPGGIQPIPNQTFPAALAALDEKADKARREGGGGAVDKTNQEALPVEAGAHGVERLLSAIEELNAMVARMLAETLVRGTYLKIHHVLRTYSPPIPQQINGQWLNVDPSQWPQRMKISVSTGLTLSERMRMAQALGAIIQRQMELLQGGSTLVNPQTLYRAMMDQARMLGVQNPESYLIDPQSPQGQQAAAQQQQQQQMAAQQQAAMAQQQLQAQTAMLTQVEAVKNQGRLQTEQIKLQGDAAQAQADLQETLLKIQADQQETAAKLAADQRQFMEELGAKYDALRVEVLKIEAQHGQQGEEPITNE